MNLITKWVWVVLLCFSTSIHAAFQVTDLLDRKVSFDQPVQRIILGEGRMLYLIAALDKENPFKRIVAWRSDLKQADPATYQAYQEFYPEMDEIPSIGNIADGGLNLEQIVALNPDLILFNTATYAALKEASTLEKLEQFGIPVLFIDFRHQPMRNTPPSISLLGKVLDQPERAEAMIAFHRNQVERVTTRLAAAQPPAPRVFIERIGGYTDDCCLSFGDSNFGQFVSMAGGENIAKKIIPSTFGQLNPEQVLLSNPEHIVVTSANWQTYVPGGHWISVGPGESTQQAEEQLAWYLDRKAYAGTTALQKRQFHAIWHQFYNSPYQFIAIQQLAKWFHPQLFSDLDPNATFAEFYRQFLPIPYQAGYFASLSSTEAGHE